MLRFEIKSTKMSIGKNKGTTLYYAKQKSHDRIQTNDLERRIERMTTLSRADVHAALIALSDVIHEELHLGRSVTLAELGTFKLRILQRSLLSPRSQPPKPLEASMLTRAMA